MKCPVCKDPDLVMSERQNIEIDYCPQCRGVWLDRGELDKIIERSQQEEVRYASAPMPEATPGQTVQTPHDPVLSPSQPSFRSPPQGGFNDVSYGHGGEHHGSGHDDHHRTRGGFLKRLFD